MTEKKAVGRSTIRRVKDLIKRTRAVHELLRVVAEEMEKSSTLERRLDAEKKMCNSLKIQLEAANQVLLENEGEIDRLKRDIERLDERLNTTLERCLINYLREHKGELSIKGYANELQISEEWVKEALESLQKKGKIKFDDRKNN